MVYCKVCGGKIEVTAMEVASTLYAPDKDGNLKFDLVVEWVDGPEYHEIYCTKCGARDGKTGWKIEYGSSIDKVVPV